MGLILNSLSASHTGIDIIGLTGSMIIARPGGATSLAATSFPGLPGNDVNLFVSGVIDGKSIKTGLNSHGLAVFGGDLVASGVINIEEMSAPSTTTDKLYNVGNALYWAGTIMTSGAASSAVAGSDTQLQYNNGGVFGGAADLTYADGSGGTMIGASTGTAKLAFRDTGNFIWSPQDAELALKTDGKMSITGSGNTARSIDIAGSGGIRIFGAGGAGKDTFIGSNAGSVGLYAGESVADAINIDAANGGVDIDATTTVDIKAQTILSLTGTNSTWPATKIYSAQAGGGVAIEADNGGFIRNNAGTFQITGSANTDSAIAILTSDASGGVDIDTAKFHLLSTNAIMLSSSLDNPNAIQIQASAGGIEIFASGSAGGGNNLLNYGGSINLTAEENAANAIYLRVNKGTSETIKIHADQGTSVTEGAASVSLLSDAGGVELRSTANLANAINITNDGGTTGTIMIFNDQGTSVAEGAESITILSDVGGVGIRSTANLANAVNITVDGGATSTMTLFNDQGTAATEGAASIQLLSDVGGINVKSNLDAANAILLTSDGGTSATIVVHNDQGTDVASIKLLSDDGGITLQTASGKSVTVNSDSLLPSGDVTKDLGSASKRWRNVYTADFHLNNDRGNWTIVEEESMLTIRNNINGKWYQLNMTEIDPTGRDDGLSAPPQLSAE